jgi:hypothetical protein
MGWFHYGVYEQRDNVRDNGSRDESDAKSSLFAPVTR